MIEHFLFRVFDCSFPSGRVFPVFQGQVGVKIVQIYIYIYIALVGRVFTKGPGDLGSSTGYVILKTLKMLLVMWCIQ